MNPQDLGEQNYEHSEDGMRGFNRRRFPARVRIPYNGDSSSNQTDGDPLRFGQPSPQENDAERSHPERESTLV